MTLIISLRIPDGIVIAGDSLSTVRGPDQSLATTFSYAQKVFPFQGKFGVGTFGVGFLVNKSIYFAMRLLEQKSNENGKHPQDVTKAAEEIGYYFHKLLKEQLKQEKKTINDLQPNQSVLGFQVVGYDEAEPKTVEVLVGREVKFPPHTGLGFTASGSNEIVKAISGLYQNKPQMPPYPVFSLQDAIDYAEFLILTTIAHHRFSQTIAKVGGDIDIALVTPFDGFQWIRQKPLGKILEGQSDETNDTR